jgi:signal transduction histidine kinase/ActR/RegA family two-component response regulator
LLSEAAALLLLADNPDAMLSNLFVKIGSHLSLDVYFHFKVDERGDGLRLASCVGLAGETNQDKECGHLNFGQAICGTAAQNRERIIATNIQASDDPQAALVKSLGVRAYACHPLVAKDKLFGTLSFGSRTRDEFAPDELDFLQTITNYVTVAYERVQLIRELSDAHRRKDEFLATLAHELRNPLAPIRNGLQLLSMANASRESTNQARVMMERQLGQLVRLVDDLMDLSRISRGKIELRREQVKLAAVIESAVETSRPLIDQMGHQLTVTIPQQTILLDGDFTRLAQVFLNLLTNAAKYSDHGSQIWLTAERQGSDVVVAVKDNGIGIPANELSQIFQMFTQVDRSLEKSQGGLGIGLSLVKRLVELHGGTIEAKSDGPGLGSEFIVRLPIVLKAPHSMSAMSTEDGDSPKSSLRILIVDDNRDAADSQAMMLRILGNETRTAYDGLEGVQLADTFRPDVVLLDIGLPKLNGFEACRRIREQPWGKKLILVAMTGWGQEEDHRRSHEAGFDGHMVKPVDPKSLIKLLAELSPVNK